MACSKYLEQINKQDSGFVWVLENLKVLESYSGITLESSGKRLLVLESP